MWGEGCVTYHIADVLYAWSSLVEVNEGRIRANVTLLRL